MLELLEFLDLNHQILSCILLINVDNNINCCHFNIYEQDKFHAWLSFSIKKFYNITA